MLPKKESDDATRASIKKEMAKPRMAKSVRTARVPGQARITPPGTVDKIIASLRTTHPEKAQIAVVGADDRYRDRRIGVSRDKISVTAKAKK
jgi:hypothetical protein